MNSYWLLIFHSFIAVYLWYQLLIRGKPKKVDSSNALAGESTHSNNNGASSGPSKENRPTKANEDVNDKNNRNKEKDLEREKRIKTMSERTKWAAANLVVRI
jgi:hypothetical protein